MATAQLLTWRHSVVVNDIKGDLFAQTAGYRSTLGPVFVLDPTGVGHTFDPLLEKQTEDELFSPRRIFSSDPTRGGAIFTQRATVMLTQLFLAARREGSAPLPYAREAIRSGLAATAERLNAISPDLATQFTHSQALRPPVLLGGVYPERRMIAAMLGCRDFIISFNQADRTWATWIAWVIEAAGYSVFFQNWDFKGNFVLEVDRAHTRSRDQIRFGSSARYECLTRMHRSALDRVAESLNTPHSSETNE